MNGPLKVAYLGRMSGPIWRDTCERAPASHASETGFLFLSSLHMSLYPCILYPREQRRRQDEVVVQISSQFKR